MSDTALAGPSAQGIPERCPACGHPVTTLDDGCCPLCNHRIVDDDVTSEDHTPYAQSRTEGRRGWWGMCRWVYSAGKHRLAHLGLARPSPASRRFARVNCMLFALAVALSAAANTGWHPVTLAPGARDVTTPNEGHGWLRLVHHEVTVKDRFTQLLEADLWWNVFHALLAGAAALIMAWIAAALLVRIVGSGAGRAARCGASGPTRLRCAVDYGTAWMTFLSFAALVTALRPLADLLRFAEQWSVRSPVVFDVVAVLIGMAGLLLGWFWFVRLAQTVHGDVRRAAVSYFLVRAPLAALVVTAAFGSAYWFGMQRLAQRLNLLW